MKGEGCVGGKERKRGIREIGKEYRKVCYLKVKEKESNKKRAEVSPGVR